jgi:hypothetical protein
VPRLRLYLQWNSVFIKQSTTSGALTILARQAGGMGALTSLLRRFFD